MLTRRRSARLSGQGLSGRGLSGRGLSGRGHACERRTKPRSAHRQSGDQPRVLRGQDNTHCAPRIRMHRHRPRHGNVARHETSAAFKAGTSACELPRIRCNAHAEFAVEPRSQRVGFDCFVTKQVHPQSGVSQRTCAMKPTVRPANSSRYEKRGLHERKRRGRALALCRSHMPSGRHQRA